MEDHHSVLTVNTTDTEYLLQSQDCQLSDYQVEIAAVNVVGVGDKYTSPPLTLDGMYLIFQTNFSFNLGENPVISFQTKGCRIVIIPEGRGGDCELNTTATRLEGAGDARVNVELPAGEYSVVVYDDEQVTEENPAYTTTLSIPGATTPVVGCVFDVLVVEPTSDSEENNCRKKTAPVEKDPVRGQESTTETPAASQDSAEKLFEESSPSEDRELKPSAESSTVSDDQTHTTTAPDTRKGKVLYQSL
ncbi:hypothetical protein GBAR_LOCUS4127 [Geodia barretti]|uniref:Uncharacterized protein n=1 Tax=Geodia barretti TaxID=519541 RepID=A0AA35W258_GEOBA|nr:hypothetical protein GBAR_LOCUS4127 [Geodia barretti]